MARPPRNVLTHLDNQNDDPSLARPQIEAIGANANSFRDLAGDMYEANAGDGLAVESGS